MKTKMYENPKTREEKILRACYLTMGNLGTAKERRAELAEKDAILKELGIRRLKDVAYFKDGKFFVK